MQTTTRPTPQLSGIGTKFEFFPTDNAPRECDVANVCIASGEDVAYMLPALIRAADAAFEAEETRRCERWTLAEGGDAC